MIKGRTVLADYYNANPGSVKAALEALVTLGPGARTIAVLGDMLELGETGPEEHREVGRSAAGWACTPSSPSAALAANPGRGARSGHAEKAAVCRGSHAEAAGCSRAKQSGNGDAVLIKGSRGMKMEKILEEF